MANVVSVNISERKGEQKHPVPEIQLKFRHGIVGDAHAGDWHRQISLLAEAKQRGIAISNASGYATQAVAELCIGLMIDLLRNVPQTDQQCRNGGTKVETL